jgi:hypothetical protein
VRSLILSTALALGGCTSSPPTTEVPAAAKPSPSVKPSEAPLSDLDKAVGYTRRMTGMGVTTKDPVVGEVLPVHLTFGRGQTDGYLEEHADACRKFYDDPANAGGGS